MERLARGARIWIHHDEAKGPRPKVDRGEVRFVSRPVRTAWGDWSLCAAVLALLREALDEPGWDYFQLLSGSCLPLGPVSEFARHIDESPFEVHMDSVPLTADDTALMTYGYRAYAARDTLQHRALHRLQRWYVGPVPRVEQRAGLSFLLPARDNPPGLPARIALAATRAVGSGVVPTRAHPFGGTLQCWMGSMWWGARRHVCEALVNAPADDPLSRFARAMSIPDECYFQTRVHNMGYAVGPSNHWISPFDGRSPTPISPRDLHAARTSGRWFARKFHTDPSDPARREALAHLDAVDA